MTDESALTDEQLSLRLAELLEPTPQFTSTTPWIFNTTGHTPRDMVHDPAMTVMLLEKVKARIAFGYRLHVSETFAEWHIDSCYSKRLGRAVAEAAYYYLALKEKP